MRTILTAALGAALLAAPAASAHPDHHYQGGCSLLLFQTGGDHWTAVADYRVYPTDAATGAPSPGTPVDGYCVVSVEGDVVAELEPGDTEVFAFTAEPGSSYSHCEFTTVGGETHAECGDGVLGGPLPPPAWDLPCAVIATQDGGPLDQPPVLDFRPDGDVYAAGEYVFDCP